MTDRPTIFALSSGRPPAAIAVIRISGTRAGDALTALGVKIPEPRKAALARIRNPDPLADNEIIDEALALWFPGPNSETGEDTAELQLHGGPAVIAATLDALSRIEGLRPAEAGEFTRRAFENGKLDLTAVEGLADLVSAETQGQRRQAFRQMKGLLGNRAETWRQRLIQALALVEARIDFSDEADVPEELIAPALAIARELAGEIEAALADGRRGERVREGLVVAIAGPPNAGKSTLLNLLAKREAAIVSPYAGTTRDVIEVHLDLGGMAVTLLDTAGIRETGDPVEMEGVRRARERAAGADLVLWLEDASAGRSLADPGATVDPSPVIPGQLEGLGPESITPVGDYGFRARPPSPSGLRPAPRNDDDLRTGAAGSEPRSLGLSIFPDRSSPVSAVVPALPPPVWLVRNKVDLIQRDSNRSEQKSQLIGSHESPLHFNKPLRNIDNSPLPSRSELKGRTNAWLTNVVKGDLTDKTELETNNSDYTFILSAVSGEGFDLLLAELTRFAAAFVGGAESFLVTRARHRHRLEETLAALRRALQPDLAGQEDLVAEELRSAAAALGRLTGRVDVEDILDVIFRDFCIGK
ncbi:MAG: tRNA modification GTPase TrmE [Bradyrhizobium sp.]|nr:tRNA modification GTPase TrmE [Bradyrhizobium sp.]